MTKQGGAYGPLRGTTAGGVAKAFRGKAGFKESQALQKKLTRMADLKQKLKNIKSAYKADKASATKTANEKLPAVKVLKDHGIKPLSKTGNYVKGKKIRIKEEYMKDGKPGFNKKSLSINIGKKSLKKYLGYL